MREFRAVLWGGLLVLVAVGSGMLGRAAGARSAARADSLRVEALTQLTLAQQEARRALRRVDSLRPLADSLDFYRRRVAARGTVALATLPSVPTSAPDTCAPWVARAAQAERAARDLAEANRLADATVDTLQRALTDAQGALLRLRQTTVDKVPVLVKQIPKPGRIRWADLLPKTSIGYGVMFPVGGGIQHGPVLSLGYQISLGRIL